MNYICTFCNYSTEDKRNYYRHLKTDRHKSNQNEKSKKNTVLKFLDKDTKANLTTANKPKNTKVISINDTDIEIDIDSDLNSIEYKCNSCNNLFKHKTS